MPTYNRAKFLPLAIQSVLQQTFEDFELIVSNGGSTDNTREVVENFDDSRIHYIESMERLGIGDNYQAALDNARGKFITFLSDDDAFLPTMLEKVKTIIEKEQAQIVVFKVAKYYHENTFDFNQQINSNTVAIPRFFGDVAKFKSSEGIQMLYHNYGLGKYRIDSKFNVSFLANAVYDHKIFKSLKKRKQKLFHTTPADLYLAAAIFYVTDFYHCLDEPLHIWSHWAKNSTASLSQNGTKLREYYEKLLNGKELEFTPLKFALPQNCRINAILEAGSDFTNNQSNVSLDLFTYFLTIYKDLIFLKSNDIDISQEMVEFQNILSEQTLDLQQNVIKEINKPWYIIKKNFLTKFPYLRSKLQLISSKRKLSHPYIVSGNKHSFDNFLGAANFLGMNLENFRG